MGWVVIFDDVLESVTPSWDALLRRHVETVMSSLAAENIILRNVGVGVKTLMPITSVEDKAQRRLEVKAKSTLMMDIPDEHQIKFNSIMDAMQLMEAIEKRFVNTTHGFSTFSTQFNTANIDNLSDSVICTFLASKPSTPLLANEDLEQIHPDDLEEMDLKWQMAMLTIRARRFLKEIGRKMTVNGNDTIGFDKSNVECYNCHKRRHFARECRALRSQDTKHKESTRRIVPVETPASTALVSCDGLSGYDWSDQAKEGLNYALMAYTSTNEGGVDCLPNDTIFEQLALLRKPRRNVTEVPRPSDPIEHVADEAVYKELDDRLLKATITASSLKANQDNGAKIPWRILLLRLGLRECLNFSIIHCSQETKTTQALAIDSLKRMVKKLEKKKRSRTYKLKRLYKVGLSAMVESFDDNEDLGEDASKQGRKIHDIDVDEDITLVNDQDDE
nr:hypothetical protein [Tanacetum cinerariifolium]